MRPRLFPGLQKIRAVTGTVERNFALLAATLGTDFSVHGRAEPLFFSRLAKRAGQVMFLESRLFHE
jgi:hypothetical protein